MEQWILQANTPISLAAANRSFAVPISVRPSSNPFLLPVPDPSSCLDESGNFAQSAGYLARPILTLPYVSGGLRVQRQVVGTNGEAPKPVGASFSKGRDNSWPRASEEFVVDYARQRPLNQSD